MAEQSGITEQSEPDSAVQSSEDGAGLGFLVGLREIVLEDALNAIAEQAGESAQDPLFDDSGRRIPRYGIESIVASMAQGDGGTRERPNTLLPAGEDESILTEDEREDIETGQRGALNGLTLEEHLNLGGEEAWQNFAEASERVRS